MKLIDAGSSALMSAMSVHRMLEMASRLHGAGQFKEAEKLYRQVISADPRNTDALHLRGILLHQTGRSEEGIKLIRRAIMMNDRVAQYYENLANVYSETKQFDRAAEALRRAIQLEPKAVTPRIRLARFLNGELDRPREAVEELRRLFEIAPDHPEALLDMAVALHRSEDKRAALGYYEKALAASPNDADILCNYGTLLNELERSDEAIAILKRGIEIDSSNPKLWYNLGLANTSKEHIEAAMLAFRQVLQIKPNHVNAKFQLSLLLFVDNQLEESIELLSQSLESKRERAVAFHDAASIRLREGRVEEAISLMRKSIAVDATYEPGWQTILMIQHYRYEDDPAGIFSEHRAWAAGHENRYPTRTHLVRRDPDRPLRIGYVSADFKQHSVLFFLEPILAGHNREQFEVFCYANQLRNDDVTSRLEGYADQWRDISGLSDDTAAHLIDNDQIDILVDLSVHSSGSRLPVFARKPAPIQMSYLGYASTTGLRAMNYRLTDAWVDPPDLSEAYNTEELIRLPHTQWVYRAPTQVEVAELPAISTGHITFGLASNLTKLNEPTVALWSKVLHGVPGSVLRIKAAGLSDGNKPAAPGAFPILRYGGKRFWENVCDRLIGIFARYGIDRTRLGFEPSSQLDHYFQWFANVDLSLDTFAFTGGTTTCHSIYMGVPVITRTGRTSVSRVGSSILHNVGLGELVADTPQRFVQIAIELANDIPRLAELRRTLRERMKKSPLMNESQFVANLEAAYRQKWRRWIAERK